MRTIEGYNTSRDYAKLWALAQKQDVVCFVDYGMLSRDVCNTSTCMVGIKCQGKKSDYVDIVARGICYLSANTESEFIDLCKEEKVEWIVPGEDSCSKTQ